MRGLCTLILALRPQAGPAWLEGVLRGRHQSGERLLRCEGAFYFRKGKRVGGKSLTDPGDSGSCDPEFGEVQ